MKTETYIKNLTKAVVDQLGYKNDYVNEDLIKTLQNIVEFGIGSGISGFTYYKDTVTFYEDNKEDILLLLENTKEGMCYNSNAEFIKLFNCLKDYDNLTIYDINYVLYGKSKKAQKNEFYEIITNALSWFAAEEIARFELEKKDI